VSWHSLNIAVSLSYSLGLHRDINPDHITAKNRGLRRRLWWTCFLRDRLIALAEGRPVRIKREDCHVPLLGVEDFDFDEKDENIGRVREAALLFVEAMLCWFADERLLGNYLRTHPVQQAPNPEELRTQEHSQKAILVTEGSKLRASDMILRGLPTSNMDSPGAEWRSMVDEDRHDILLTSETSKEEY
jgi:hypothetical protein